MIGEALIGIWILASPQSDILLAGGILILVLTASVFVVRWIQKHWDPRRQSDSNSSGALTIEQIEAMHEGGRISDEEFAAMRRLVMKLPNEKESESKSSCSDSIIDDSKGSRTDTSSSSTGPEDS